MIVTSCRGFPDYRLDGTGDTLPVDRSVTPSSLGRVLVVEDEPRVGATLRDILVELGYVVELADRAPRRCSPCRSSSPMSSCSTC